MLPMLKKGGSLTARAFCIFRCWRWPLWRCPCRQFARIRQPRGVRYDEPAL